MRRLLLCTDLDRTLIANGAQPESNGALALFRQLVRREDVTLVYVSGRHRALIEQAIVQYDLPSPDFAIADVGSTVLQVTPSGWQPNDAWDAQIAPDWHGLAHDDLCRLLSVFPALRLQPREQQNRYKLSYHVALAEDSPALMRAVDARMKDAHIKANLVWSIDEPASVGLLDVLPAGANKLHAIRFLMQQQGYQDEDTLFAGDSGNDLDVLLSGIPAVLVANADPQVKSQAAAANPDTLYVARGGYLGMNGNYSAGILEGVAHYHPALDAWLRAQN
jgi:sucrose-6F-phosphate phosphohydrolase